MDFITFEELVLSIIHSQTDPGQIQDAFNAIQNFLLDPKSIFVIFHYIDEERQTSNQHQNNILISFWVMRLYVRKNYHKLSPDLQNQIFNKLCFYINLNFNEKEINIISDILRPMIKNNEQRISTLLDIIKLNTQELLPKNYLLILAISNLNKNSPLLLQNKSMLNYFLSLSLNLSSEHDNILESSFRLYFLLKERNLIDSDEIFVGLLANMQSNSNFLIWPILSQNVSKNLIPKEYLNKLFDLAVNFFKNDESQIEVFHFILKCISILDQIDFIQFLGLFNEFFIQNFEETNFLCFKSSFNLIAKYLLKHPTDNLYNLLKQSTTFFLPYYFIIIKVSWNDFYSNIDSFFEDIQLTIDMNNEKMNVVVCYLLEELQSKYLLDDFYSLKFMKEIAHFLSSGDCELIDAAFQALDPMIDQIQSPFPNLLEYLVQISTDQWDDRFISIFINLIKYDENVDSNQLLRIADIISPDFNDSKNIRLIVLLMKRNKELIDTLLPQLLDNLKNKPKKQIIFINSIYDSFGYIFDPQIEPIVKNLREVIVNDSKGDKLSNDALLLNLYSLFVKNTNDKELAAEILKLCINFLKDVNENTFNIVSDDDDDDNDDGNDFYEDNEDNDEEIHIDKPFNRIYNVICSCYDIIKLLDRIELKKMLFYINLYINNMNNKEIIETLLKVMTKLLHHSCDEDKEIYLTKCNNVLDKIINGKLKALNGQDILSTSPTLIDEVGLLMFEVVRYQSPFVETISNFILKVLKTCQNNFYYSTYVSACYYLIENKTGSQKVIEEIIDLIPTIMKDTNLISLKQNIAFLFVPLIQYNEKTFQKLIQFVPILYNWFLDEKKNECIHYAFLSTIAMVFLTFFANGMTIDAKILNQSINEFPPKDKKDTSSMISKIIKIFSSNKLESSCIQNAAFALSKLFLLDDFDLKKRKVSPELMNSALELFISFSDSNPEIWQYLNEKYMKVMNII